MCIRDRFILWTAAPFSEMKGKSSPNSLLNSKISASVLLELGIMEMFLDNKYLIHFLIFRNNTIFNYLKIYLKLHKILLGFQCVKSDLHP